VLLQPPLPAAQLRDWGEMLFRLIPIRHNHGTGTTFDAKSPFHLLEIYANDRQQCSVPNNQKAMCEEARSSAALQLRVPSHCDRQHSGDALLQGPFKNQQKNGKFRPLIESQHLKISFGNLVRAYVGSRDMTPHANFVAGRFSGGSAQIREI